MTHPKESSSSSRMKSTGRCDSGHLSPPLDGSTPELHPSHREGESFTTSELDMTPVEFAALRELETLYESLHTLMSQHSCHPTRMSLSYSPFLNSGTIEVPFYLTKTLQSPSGSPLSQKRGQLSEVQINSNTGMRVIRATREIRISRD